jgi:hypothetical protein
MIVDDFRPIDKNEDPHPAVVIAHSFIARAELHKHEFFARADESQSLLRIWVGQELFVTNPFAQLLLGLAAQVGNVHLRSLIVSVANGEHSGVKNGIANKSHPWLLHELATAMKVDFARPVELRGTRAFLASLEVACARSPVAAVGALGIGNEALLVPEYSRVLLAFERCIPEIHSSEFLTANINEDRHHAEIMDLVASVMLRSGASEDEYLAAADASVNARLAYYDSLLVLRSS